jgi:predicted esterase
MIVSSIFARDITNNCEIKPNFIYVAPECIQIHTAIGEQKGSLIVLLHGMWKDGANVLGIYSSFGEDVSMQTDKTVVAVAQPGYSGSSTHKFKAIISNKKQTKNKKYLKFISNILKKLKSKHKTKTLVVVAHSAGASMIASIMTVNKGLIQVALLAGGKYDNIDTKKLDKKAKYIVIYGDKDKISPPRRSINFHKRLQKQKLDTTILAIKDTGHAFLDTNDKVVEELIKLP